ncbi:hypothetical protein CRV08_08050 [Halarcobacter ebronensis]|uniref:Uncharacterized protein n=1 Tax=Halarcobacter ebronensis TaxID=1462615 RepID=A0A4V1LRH3_9BACT|nr:hypothetical protein [Halarcobacter ebronensis]QKF81660.1 hypothetical protein AEBR_1165 [Halarcobacter ebronensis]RXJ68198.1 hypothetical protein CRV08_08050 [Halarcobacter ebronensis]RXK05584.1 hypothetical protein CRV07_08735 [Halarcobacter ebronensis]
MENKLTFHINNMAYTIVVDETLSHELTKFLDVNKSMDTRDLLAAYIRIAQEFASFKNELEEISEKIPKL